MSSVPSFGAMDFLSREERTRELEELDSSLDNSSLRKKLGFDYSEDLFLVENVTEENFLKTEISRRIKFLLAMESFWRAISEKILRLNTEELDLRSTGITKITIISRGSVILFNNWHYSKFLFNNLFFPVRLAIDDELNQEK